MIDLAWKCCHRLVSQGHAPGCSGPPSFSDIAEQIAQSPGEGVMPQDEMRRVWTHLKDATQKPHQLTVLTDDLSEIEGRHRKTVDAPRETPYCPEDEQYWPCDATRLVAEIRRLRRDQDWVRAAVTANRDVCESCAAEIARAGGWTDQ